MLLVGQGGAALLQRCWGEGGWARRCPALGAPWPGLLRVRLGAQRGHTARYPALRLKSHLFHLLECSLQLPPEQTPLPRWGWWSMAEAGLDEMRRVGGWRGCV